MKFFWSLYLITISLFAENSVLGVKTLSYFDDAREREVVVEFWYPTEETLPIEDELWHKVWVYPKEVRNATALHGVKNRPLILFSHGSQGDRRDRAWLAAELVKNGFIVASIDHHKDTWDTSDFSFYLSPWDRPLDISFALTSLLNEESISYLIDSERIGFSGFSLGGMTGLWLAGGKIRDLENITYEDSNKSLPKLIFERMKRLINFKKVSLPYNDDRIKAYFLLAPAAWEFCPESIKNISSPVHIVGLKNDKILPFEIHSSFLIDLLPFCEKTIFEGMEGHCVFLNRATSYGEEVLYPAMFLDHESVDREKVHAETAEKVVHFFEKYL